MLLTVSKRVEFSASRRLFSARRSPEENVCLYGAESAAEYGTGRNYVAYFIFAGAPDPITGMLINISEIKARAGSVINERYDHRFLNYDNSAFAEEVPTAENIARHLLSEVAPLFSGESARLVAVHLREEPGRSATAYADDTIESHYWFDFSAARQTMSPHLSVDENQQLFGGATREHGHHYRARLTFSKAPARAEVDGVIRSWRTMFDHRHLNREVKVLRGQPITTETLTRLILQQSALSPVRVRLHERDDFFAEATSDGGMFLGLRESFSAAHRLHVSSFSIERNADLFGKCNNPRGHGHRYVAETTIAGEYDARSGTVANLEEFRGAVSHALEPWRDKHLDRETIEFQDVPSTGENIVRVLWPKLDSALGETVTRLRLWETANNRFTLRRT
ncbi:MAG: 6-carboxytetrahydropterin synthase [Verrucomicrobiota bacterium]|nr:6-carboxytetrahydropterin synthase [Verrucomicrobiota bacterium]